MRMPRAGRTWNTIRTSWRLSKRSWASQKSSMATRSRQPCAHAGDIYARGSGDVGRDYSEQVQWYAKAKAMGVEIPVLNKRNF